MQSTPKMLKETNLPKASHWKYSNPTKQNQLNTPSAPKMFKETNLLKTSHWKYFNPTKQNQLKKDIFECWIFNYK
jgi:hypothetical protein